VLHKCVALTHHYNKRTCSSVQWHSFSPKRPTHIMSDCRQIARLEQSDRFFRSHDESTLQQSLSSFFSNFILDKYSKNSEERGINQRSTVLAGEGSTTPIWVIAVVDYRWRPIIIIIIILIIRNFYSAIMPLGGYRGAGGTGIGRIVSRKQ